MKIVSTGSTLSSPEFLEKRNKARRRRTTFWIAGILALLVIAVIISRREEFLISEVSVSGAIVVKEEDIALAVEAIISGHYLFLVPKGNALIYPGGLIEKKLLQTFPRLSAVAASLEGMRLLRIDAAEREPFALYCSSALSPEDASECYFLDDNGFIFDEAPSFSGSVYFIYAKVPPLPEPVGREFLPTEEFKPLSQFIGSLEDLGIESLALEAGEEGRSLILPLGGRILFSRSSDLTLLYSDLKAFLNNDSIRSQTDFLEKVSELDLRTKNKIRWTFK